MPERYIAVLELVKRKGTVAVEEIASHVRHLGVYCKTRPCVPSVAEPAQADPRRCRVL